LNRCAETRLVARLARGDLDPAEEQRLRAHVAGCAECTAELEAEEKLTARLRSGIPRPSAPGDLRAAVEAIVRGRVAVEPRARRVRRRLFAVAAVAALLAIGVALALAVRSRDPVAVATRHAAATFHALDSERTQLAAESAESDARLRDLTQRHGLPAATAFHGDEEVRLVSVRQGSVLGRTSALLVYVDRQGRLVTLEILPGTDVTIPRERTRAVKQFRPMLARAGDVGVALWKQGASLYLLTAPVGEDELADLYLKVRTHTS
jgi:anti-sigma factor RsiW